MRLYPAIDVKNGKCVRLKQGQFDQETVYSNSPADIAKRWEEAGSSFIHVVDLDGALDGKWTNKEAISSIVKAVKIPVQTGGGVRSLNDIKLRLEVGINRVILGTLAIKQPEIVKEAIDLFGAEKIVVGIDAKDGMVAVHGWEEVSSVSALDLCLKMKAYGVTTIVYTDIAKDGMMSGPNIEQTKALVEKTGLDIIASGGVSNIEDLKNVASINAEGAIIGKALYTDAINLEEAVQLFEGGE
jgi:phosphoribosylformimino-5-aminoimidazole carboxamide ribotide isomerase